jgi:hypothetical protein
MCPSIADFAVASLTAAGFGWWSWTVGAVGFPRRHDEFALGLCALPFAVRGVVLRVAASWVQHGDMLELNPVCAPSRCYSHTRCDYRAVSVVRYCTSRLPRASKLRYNWIPLPLGLDSTGAHMPDLQPDAVPCRCCLRPRVGFKIITAA